MKLSNLLPSGSQYLKASDLPERASLEVIIDRVEVETIQDGSDGESQNPVLYFCSKEKGLVLNKTNGLALIEAFGDEIDKYAGQHVTLYRTKTQFQGKLVDCLRLRIPSTDGQPTVADAVPF